MDFSTILSLWPGVGCLSGDLGCPYHTVTAWKRRKSIPVQYWDALLASARRRNIDVTQSMLVEAARSQGRKGRARRSPRAV